MNPRTESISSSAPEKESFAWPVQSHPMGLSAEISPFRPAHESTAGEHLSLPAPQSVERAVSSNNSTAGTLEQPSSAAAAQIARVAEVPHAATQESSIDIPPIFPAPQQAVEVPAPIQSALSSGAPVRFSSESENQQAGRQPDYFFTPEGKLEANPNASPSPDGSINIQIQSQDAANNKSLRDAITHETEMQRAAAQDMIRMFQKSNPGKAVPGWMRDLAEAKPNLPDFVPFPPSQNSAPASPPENGFTNRGVSGGGGGGSGFSGNGGFDGNGYFRGNGGSGDGSIPTGGRDSHGQPLGPGEQVQAKQLYDYFVEHGFTAAQASGILGNIQTESSFRTNAYNAGEGAIGLCQWEGSRRVDLENFAREQGKPVTDWHVQADFIMHELTHKESGAMAAIKAATTPEQAAQAFQSRYERSASLGDRAANARNIHNTLA